MSGNIFMNREGNVISIERWAQLNEDPDYRFVKVELVGDDHCVVTGWRGFDPYRLPTEDGVRVNIFECIGFRRAANGHRLAHVDGLWTSGGMEKYWAPDSATEAEALVQHAKLVELIKERPSRN